MKVTAKEIKSFNAMLADTWAPSANDNYNIATFGMNAARFYEMRKFVDSKFGMKFNWPRPFKMSHFKD
jgi:hypothetical protein